MDSLSYLRATSGAVSQQTAPATLHILPVGPSYILKILFLTLTTMCVQKLYVLSYVRNIVQCNDIMSLKFMYTQLITIAVTSSVVVTLLITAV